MLKEAVASVLQDESFEVPSRGAAEALSVTSDLSAWCHHTGHQLELSIFADEIGQEVLL